MASPNPLSSPIDMHKLLMPTTSNQNPNPPPPNLMIPPPPLTSTIPSSSYPSPTGLQNPHFLFHYPPEYHPQHLPPYPPPPPPSYENPNPNNNFPPVSNMQPQGSYPTPPLQRQPQPQPQQQPLSPRNNNERSGAEIMALLRTPSNQEYPPAPPSQQHPPEFLGPQMNVNVPPMGPIRMPSSKMPKGRRVVGKHVAYDVDVRLSGEVQPQLEVSPITKYTSDPQLCLGRQIAVNKSYICYGLKQGTIRVLNSHTALRSLFRTQSQRVTDMAFFAEDVHLLASAGIDGRINVWKISEVPDEDDKQQIIGKTVLAVQVLGDGGIKNPRVCWHCYKQEILVVGVGKQVLRIDTNRVGKGEPYSSESPLLCNVDKLIDGIQIVGKHDGEVTDLSMCQWMSTRLVSASLDGTIKIWEDLKALPLVVLRPHDGQPVYSATFLTAPNQPDHIVLITAGPQNRELKIWASTGEEGCFLPSNTDSLNCYQTLELKSSAESHVEGAFFNQVIALAELGLLLLANAKRNAIYAIHLDYGSNPAATHMDYISEYTVTMPILSLTGTIDALNGQYVAQIFCVQTQAIQQYTLDLCQCLQPPLENSGLDRADSSVSHDVANAGGFTVLEHGGSKFADVPISSAPIDVTSLQDVPSNMDSNPLASTDDTDVTHVPSSHLPLKTLSEVKVVAQLETNPSTSDHQMDNISANLSDMPSLDNDSGNNEKKVAQDNNSSVLNHPITFKHPTHLITPAEIVGAKSSDFDNINEGSSEFEAKIQDVVANGNSCNAEVEVQVVGEQRSTQNDEFGLHGEPSENKEKFFYSQASGLGIQMARECSAVSSENYSEETGQDSAVGMADFLVPPHAAEEVIDSSKDASGKVSSLATSTIVKQSSTPSTKGKKQKGRIAQASGQSSSSPGVFNSTDSSNEQGRTSSLVSVEAAFPQILAIQEMLNQLLSTQKEMQKQMTNMIAIPVSKECRRLEAALGRSIEKAVKANTDALWARFQEENAKNEKLLRDRTQQITNLISNFVNKDLMAMLEKVVKKELTSIGPAMVRTVSPVIEKAISSAISESFQRGASDKAMNQLEKSVNLKLEATVARQIQAQFQTSGKLALQDALKAGMEASLIPAFEMSCKAMFDQVDSAFRQGMVEHTTATQQHFDSAHSSLAFALREAINTASSLTQTLSGELADGQQKLLALAAAGANSTAANPSVSQLSNGPLAVLNEKVEKHVDPTKELSRLLTEGKFEEAFTMALQRSDVSIVSWLCSQVDLRGILSMVPLSLSQGVLLSLLQQLACDINKDTNQKLAWMTDVAAAINSADQMIAVHVRPILEQVCQILHHRRSVPGITGTEMSNIRVLMHIINSVLVTCK